GEPRRGIYLISDSSLDFWFNFVFKNRESIERETVSLKEGSLSPHFGKRFEILIRDDVFHRIFRFQTVGKWWHRDKEIDLVAMNKDRGEVLFGECKWRDNVNAEEILERLRSRTNGVKLNFEKRRECYALFAKSFRRRVEEKNVFCYDLKDLEILYQKIAQQIRKL
nr:DUF234 domain-containing protein [Candidatus Freyarchaeota archaeon]